MRVLRSLTGLVLAMALVLTSFAAGVARGQATPVGMMEICQGVTAVTVAMDADGQPVGPDHVCDDGLMALFGQAGLPQVIAQVETFWLRAAPVPLQIVLAHRDTPLGSARGPPFSV